VYTTTAIDCDLFMDFDLFMLLLVSGTSASSPFVAGLFALINSARLQAQKSSLGWINPTLYSLDPSIFNDVTNGMTTDWLYVHENL